MFKELFESNYSTEYEDDFYSWHEDKNNYKKFKKYFTDLYKFLNDKMSSPSTETLKDMYQVMQDDQIKQVMQDIKQMQAGETVEFKEK